MKTLIAILVLALASPASADDGVQDSLKKQLVKHILVLRTPLQPGDQEFDSSGKPLKELSPDQVRVYGPLLITSIKTESGSVQLEGVRVCSAADLNPDKRTLLQSGKAVKVKILLEHPLNSDDEAQAILDRVFFLDLKQSQYSLPEYRRAEENLGADHKIYNVGNGVQAPRPVLMPNPSLTAEARKAKYQGTVVLGVVIDASGRATRIKLVRSLGMGLDDNAMDKVVTWLFRPALRNGQAVAVQVNIEVSYNLY